jgi:hypothetical protein
VAEKGRAGDAEYASETDFDYLLSADESQERDGSDAFDAFDENNWVEVVSPLSTPWYRSRQPATLLIASATALSAIVVSVVLLFFRGPTDADEPAPLPPTTPVTTPLATATSEEPPPPPPPEPPPGPGSEPEPEPSTMERAPAVVRPTVRPRPTKAPEIGVTRTPETRQPMSVAPQPRKPRN